MERRLRRQLIYGFSFLGFWAILFGSIYFIFLKQAASCFDNRQNQREEGVDCGGPCLKVCIPANLLPVQMAGAPIVFYPDANHVAVLAQIQNQNDGWGAKHFRYTFEMFGPGDIPLYTRTGTSFIYPGEFKYILLPDLPYLGGVNRVEFSAAAPEWARSDMFQTPRISVVNQQVRSSNNQLTVQGQVTNAEAVSFGSVTLIAVFYGQLGQVEGASQTTLNNLLPNETRPFTILYPAGTNVNGATAQVFVAANRQ